MSRFLGVKMVEATPATYKQFLENKKDTKIKDNEEGYIIKYDNGYTSWSPKKVFEHSYFPISDENSITKTEIDSWLNLSKYKTNRISDKTTIVTLINPTTFEEVESSSCVDPDNYNENVGARIALNKLINKIGSKLGFVLQWGKNGIDNNL